MACADAAPIVLPPMAGWTVYGQGFQSDATVRHGSNSSLCCRTTAGGQTTGAFTTVVLNQSRAVPLSIAGWSRADGVDGVADNDYSIYVDVTYADGSALWGQTALFETGTHDWQRQALTLFPSKPVKSLNVYALLRNHTGTAWFSGFTVKAVSSNALFDSQALASPVLPPGRQSGWFVRDVAAGSSLQPIEPGKDALGLRLSRLQVTAAGRIVTGALQNLTAKDRAVTLYYVERLDTPHPRWGNTVRDSVLATEAQEYANLTQAGAGATGQLSLYPFGCVCGQKSGRALGLPPTLGPRVFRVAFRPDTHLLFLACDLALTGSGDLAHHDRAPVSVARYSVNPAWGFRDAAATWYALFPDAYKRLALSEGIWMPFTDPAKVANLSDFHFAYHEGDNSVGTDRAAKIQSFKYVEPMTYWMPMAKETPRTYMSALAQAKILAVSGDETAKRQAQAALTSGSMDTRGQLNVAFRNAPWCDGAVWVLNPDPRLKAPAALWTKARLNRAGEPVPGRADQPDGEYLDSLEAWADVLDYRPESLRASAVPLCFAPGRFRPALPTWFSTYASASVLSLDLHRHGKLLMANSVPWRFTAFAPLLDVMGTETNTFGDSGEWTPEPDAIMCLRRTASYHKPYLLLLNTDFSKVGFEKISLYFERCLFYGIYPSMFSVNAADHPYWENPALYNRDRPLFQKYVPLVQTLSAAGWEPITWARSSSSSVWLERYGTSYLSVLNAGSAPIESAISVDTMRLFPAARRGDRLTVRDLTMGQDIADVSCQAVDSIRVTLAGGQTRVLSLRLIESKNTSQKRTH